MAERSDARRGGSRLKETMWNTNGVAQGHAPFMTYKRRAGGQELYDKERNQITGMCMRDLREERSPSCSLEDARQVGYASRKPWGAANPRIVKRQSGLMAF